MMERKFYTDNFEKLLKENADQFKMYPSKKVWHGLYNDLHPGRRWPSITISIIFLFSLVIIGHLNTGNNHRQQIAANLLSSKPHTEGRPVKSSHPGANVSSDESDITDNGAPQVSILPSTENSIQADAQPANSANTIDPNLIANTSISSTSVEPLVGLKKTSTNKVLTGEPGNPANQLVDLPDNNTNHNMEDLSIHNNGSEETKTNSDLEKQEEKSSDKNLILESNNDLSALMDGKERPAVTTPNINSSTKKQDNKKAETVTTSSSILPRIKKENISWTYYVSPSVSYRNISTAPLSNPVVANGPVQAVNTSSNNSRQFPSIGLEAGASVNYKLYKKLQFVTGLQLNYTRYNIKANFIHPTMASLYLSSEASGTPYSLTAISIYGNGTSTGQSAEVTLHNYSFQASLPLGLQYELFGNDKIKLNAVATFQPSFIMKNQSYILSTDKRNYLTDADLMRTWNLNTSFGTYISFKTNTLNWQIGPQIRYQILSTYTSSYLGKEHLMDYGVRLGVSKIIK